MNKKKYCVMERGVSALSTEKKLNELASKEWIVKCSYQGRFIILEKDED